MRGCASTKPPDAEGGVNLSGQLGLHEGADLFAARIHDAVPAEVQLGLVELEQIFQRLNKAGFLGADGWVDGRVSGNGTYFAAAVLGDEREWLKVQGEAAR